MIVAGGSGFLGRHVIEALLAHGHSPVVLSRRPERASSPGVVVLPSDVATAELECSPLGGADAIVNLIGIKREEGTQTFEAVHVDATRRLVAAARGLGIGRMVHVSVVCSRPDSRSPYHDTKWRAERLVAESGLSFTVLRPGVIYGPGDDMISQLVKTIRFSPFLPLVGNGDSKLQPVDVRDVAEAVAVALGRPESVGKTYDIVGPEPLDLVDVERTVAQATGLHVYVVPTPSALLRPAVRVMNAVSRNPPSTPAQLRMLQEGMVGDPEPARRELGLEPRPLRAAALQGVVDAVPRRLSLRLVTDSSHAAWLRGHRADLVGVLALAVLAAALIAWLPVAGFWWRMALGSAILVPLSFLAAGRWLKPLLRPSWGRVVTGLLAGGLQYLAGAGVFVILAAYPRFATDYVTANSWRAAVPMPVGLVLLAIIVTAEEVLWRGVVTLPLAARLGPGLGILAGAALAGAAHLALGLPLLVVAAFAAGAFWGILAVRTRSLVPSIVCHFLFDVMIFYVRPY